MGVVAEVPAVIIQHVIAAAMLGFPCQTTRRLSQTPWDISKQ